MPTTRFGRQDAQLHLYRQRWSVARAAEELTKMGGDEITATHLRNAVTGRTVPSPAVRAKLPLLLGLKLSDLFSETVLAAEYRGPAGSTLLAKAAAQ